LNHISSDNEETSAREFIEQSGYSVLEGCVLERPSYRQSQNEGKAITEVIFKSLQSKANALLQSIVDKL
jgi:chromosome partitioning protein